MGNLNNMHKNMNDTVRKEGMHAITRVLTY